MKITISIITILFVNILNAQQLHIVSQYDQHRFLHNPAGAALKGANSVGMTYRSQWKGISGSPITQMVYGEKYFEKKRLGMAAVLYNDVTGPTQRTGLQYAINYQLPLNAEATKVFTFGMEARGLQYRIDKARLSQSIAGDPVLSGSNNLTKGDAGVGVYFSTPKLNIGASIGQLLQSGLRFADNITNATQRASLYRHYYIMGDYTYTDNETKVIPSFQIVYLPSSPIELAYGVRLEHKEIFWWGLHLRHKQGWMINAGYKIKKNLSLGYAFDIYKTPLSIFSTGYSGHEVMLKYNFNKVTK